MFISASYWADLTEWFHQVRGRFKPEPAFPPESERAPAALPVEGSTVSVETALNSRCTSDHDMDQKVFHWGLFDPQRRLTEDHVHQILLRSLLPDWAVEGVKIEQEGCRLVFVVDDGPEDQHRRRRMIAAGMSQQAVCLVCAAWGAGMIFKSQGIHGRRISGSRRNVMEFQIDAMQPSYGSSYWTDAPPGSPRPWRSGNLPDPGRTGSVPLAEAFKRLQSPSTGARSADEADLGQILWAARGRTPHLYKSKAWGMTIPTWAGIQNLSEVHLIEDRSLYRYINWQDGFPTHRLEAIKPWRGDLGIHEAHDAERCIVLSVNEDSGRAYWEIGYQLLNILLQAAALDCSVRLRVLKDEEQSSFAKAGIDKAVAIVCLG